jgi:cold shock protein
VVQQRQGLRLHHARQRGKDLFVHHSAITGSGYKSLEEGAKVEYEEEQGPKGPNAANVRTI